MPNLWIVVTFFRSYTIQWFSSVERPPLSNAKFASIGLSMSSTVTYGPCDATARWL